MAEEYDLSEAISQTPKITYKEKNRKRRRKQLIVAGVSTVVILGFFAGGLNNWFAKNDFTAPIPLSENVTRWTGFEWAYGDSNTLIENEFGKWERTEKGAPFLNDESTCLLRVLTSGSIAGALVSDEADSKNYTSIFAGDTENATKSVWLALDGYPTGSIEVLKTSYTTTEGKPAIAYYRSMVKTEQVFTAVLSCDTQEELDKVAPYEGDGDELTKMKVSIKPL